MPQQPCETLQVLCVGHASFDLTMTVEHHPGPDEKCSATGLVKCGGGPAANAAVAIARLGGTSAFAGYLGEDFYGTQHFDELMLNGVRTELVVRGMHPTPLSFILVKPDGSRTVINCKTGTPLLEIEQIDFACCSPKVVLFDGHEPQISLPLANSALRNKVVTVLDAGSVHQGTVALTPLVDYLAASEKYARDFTGEQEHATGLEGLAPAGSFRCNYLRGEGIDLEERGRGRNIAGVFRSKPWIPPVLETLSTGRLLWKLRAEQASIRLWFSPAPQQHCPARNLGRA